MSELRKSISPTLLRREPAEVYKIKLGVLGEERPKSSGDGTYRLPEKLDHFRVTKREREGGDRDANYVRADDIHRQIGDEPTELAVRLMFDEPERNFFSQMQQYKGRERIRECDGETARDPRNETTEPCSHPDCSCKPYGRLQVILEAAPTFGSVAVLRTTSWETVRNVQTTLELLSDQFGFLMGLPLMLRVYPATDQYEQGGKTRSSTSYKVALELRGGFEDARQIALEAHRLRLDSGKDLKMLAAGTEEEVAAIEEAETQEIVEEFHPDPNARADVETADRIERIKERAGVEPLDDQADEKNDTPDRDRDSTTAGKASSASSETETPSGSPETSSGSSAESDRPTIKAELWQLFGKYLPNISDDHRLAYLRDFAHHYDDWPDRLDGWEAEDFVRAIELIDEEGLGVFVPLNPRKEPA